MLTWGAGDRVALLIHGMLGAASQFHQLGPELAARGYRAVAIDLPGHGDSPRMPDATMERFVEAVVTSIDPKPALAIGHSLGAVLLSEAHSRLRPERAVYVDVPLDAGEPSASRSELRVRFAESRAMRTEARLRAARPEWSSEDCRLEALAAECFDVETAVALESSYVGHATGCPTLPSLVIHADPSRYVSQARAQELQRLGFRVRSIPGAGHCVWYGHLDEFLKVVEEWW
jgi:pimeloyl-ACP methyl ester carboxylesterase